MSQLLGELDQESCVDCESTQIVMVTISRPSWLPSESIQLTKVEFRRFLQQSENQNGAWVVIAYDKHGLKISESLVRWISDVFLWLNEGCVTRGTL